MADLVHSSDQALQKIWGHVGLELAQKVKFFHARVVSMLQYGLSSMWLVTVKPHGVAAFPA